jgi:hypothetical protein
VLKVAKRFAKVKFAIVGPTGTPTDNVAQYDVLQAQIGFVAGAVAAMLSKYGAVSHVGGMEIPAIVNTGKEFGNGAGEGGRGEGGRRVSAAALTAWPAQPCGRPRPSERSAAPR